MKYEIVSHSFMAIADKRGAYMLRFEAIELFGEEHVSNIIASPVSGYYVFVAACKETSFNERKTSSFIENRSAFLKKAKEYFAHVVECENGYDDKMFVTEHKLI